MRLVAYGILSRRASTRENQTTGGAAGAAPPVGSLFDSGAGGASLRPLISVVIAVPVVAASESLREFRIRFNQKLWRTMRPNENRVRVEPHVRVSLNVERHLLDAVDHLEMRRA